MIQNVFKKKKELSYEYINVRMYENLYCRTKRNEIANTLTDIRCTSVSYAHTFTSHSLYICVFIPIKCVIAQEKEQKQVHQM